MGDYYSDLKEVELPFDKEFKKVWNEYLDTCAKYGLKYSDSEVLSFLERLERKYNKENEALNKLKGCIEVIRKHHELIRFVQEKHR